MVWYKHMKGSGVILGWWVGGWRPLCLPIRHLPFSKEFTASCGQSRTPAHSSLHYWMIRWWTACRSRSQVPVRVSVRAARQSLHLTPPASLRKYYDCITQTIFMCKKRSNIYTGTPRTDGHIASDWVLADLTGLLLDFLFKEGQGKCLHSAV